MQRILQFIACMLFLTSCEFVSTEKFESDLHSDIEGEDLEIINLTIESDTLYVTDSLIIQYEFTTQSNEVLGVEVLINTQLYYASEGGKGQFLIDPEMFFPGYYKLALKIYTETNSGSIADILGYEVFRYESPGWIMCIVEKPESDPI